MRIGEYIDQALRSEQPLEKIVGDRAFVALTSTAPPWYGSKNDTRTSG